MLEKLKYKNILKTINQFITDENFKNNLNILISDMEQISEYTLSINHQRTGYINWSGKLNNEYLDLKIIINKNSIEYIYDVSSKNSTIYGKFYKIKNHSIIS